MWRRALNTTVYAIAMAYVETMIVVYLRRLYYPQGFDFPLMIIDIPTLFLELQRETATIVMLVTIGCAAGRTKVGKLAHFLLAFGVWDIFYYVWLKVTLGWPDSLLTWDVLFLIPVPWIAPVLPPVTISLTMIGMGLVLLHLESRGPVLPASGLFWLAQGLAVALGIVSFTLDVLPLLPEQGKLLAQWTPTTYRWWMLIVAQLSALSSFIGWARKAYKHVQT